jgi:hypothetical protein
MPLAKRVPLRTEWEFGSGGGETPFAALAAALARLIFDIEESQFATEMTATGFPQSAYQGLFGYERWRYASFMLSVEKPNRGQFRLLPQRTRTVSISDQQRVLRVRLKHAA